MRLYERHVLPRLVDLSMRQQRLVDYRTATISAALEGRLLKSVSAPAAICRFMALPSITSSLSTLRPSC